MKWISTLPYVYVIQAYKEILTWPVLKPAVAVTLTAPLQKNATLYLEVALLENNVHLSVSKMAIAWKGLNAQPEIIRNHAPVDIH